MTTIEQPRAAEHADLLATLERHRGFLRYTARGLTEEQARRTPTASECCVGGLIKHVAEVEEKWVRFIEEGPSAIGDFPGWDSPRVKDFLDGFRMTDSETLAGILERYEQAAARTATVIAGLDDLDVAHPLPKAPWFEEGASWTARRTLLHILTETTQHAGHADIIRETIDGQKTMG